MNFCDVCGYPTTAEEGTGYTAKEFRRMVLEMGFGPDESMINSHVAMGISRQEAINQWKNVLVAGSATGWLLCPKCATRASKYLYKPAGSGMEGLGATETMNSVIATAAAAAKTAQQNQTYNKGGRKNLKYIVYAVITIIVILILISLFLGK